MGDRTGMEILHAYWRMDYLRSESDPLLGHPNPFVALPAMGDDAAALIVHRGNGCYVVLNRYPYNAGHLLVVPYREVARLDGLTADERAELMDLLVRSQAALTKVMQPDGFNVGFNFGCAAGAGIPTHLHAHVVPRWQGDSNFLTVIGKTRTLPQALEQTRELLAVAFADV